VACLPSVAGGFPACPLWPRLNGRNSVAAPASRVVWVAVGAVLRPSVLDGLVGQLVLELDRPHGQPVHPKAEIKGLGVLGAVPLLSGDGHPVGEVPLDEQWGEAVRRFEVAEVELEPPPLHAMAEHVDRAPLVDLCSDALAELDLGAVWVVAHLHEQLVPLVDLGLPDEGQQFGWRDPARELDVIGETCVPATVVDERVEHLVLEVPLLRLRH
jgi:hypothetical protein